MKELSIEEKAKAYDEALEKARLVLQERGNEPDGASILSELFSELTESEDEKIRKKIIQLVNDAIATNAPYKKEMLAWLEKQGKENPLKGTLGDVFDDLKLGIDPSPKQGEQKPIDKVKPKFKAKPKFKVGDWIVRDSDGFTTSIESVRDEIYYFHQGGNLFVEDVDKSYNLWTIQDAKDGDVLAWDDSKCIALFKNIYDEDSFNSYGFVGHCTGIFESRQAYHDIKGAHPATEEQRDLLLQKIKEAGYEWDEENKDLKKI